MGNCTGDWDEIHACTVVLLKLFLYDDRIHGHGFAYTVGQAY